MELTYSISTGSRESQQGERTVSSYITILHIDGLLQVVPERTILSVKFPFELRPKNACLRYFQPRFGFNQHVRPKIYGLAASLKKKN